MRKYVMLALVAIFTMSVGLNAQDQRPPRAEGEKRMHVTPKERAERLAKNLELTDAEKAKVEALYEEQDKKHEKMRAEAQKQKQEAMESREDMKTRFEAERKVQDAELEKIIGKEKMEKLEKMRAERREKMKEKRGEGTRPE